MCGILAIVGKHKYDSIPRGLTERGIDDSGIYKEDGVQLIQTRLQITGFNRTDLPLRYDKYVLLFNGEIYNYLELNKELSEFEFKYDSDFETILYSYIKWGDSFIDRLDGQYAIFIWNIETKEHKIFIDPFKIKSLYSIDYDNSVIYSSNIRSLKGITFDKLNITGYGNVSNARLL